MLKVKHPQHRGSCWELRSYCHSSRTCTSHETQEGAVLHKGGITRVQGQAWVAIPLPVDSHQLINRTRWKPCNLVMPRNAGMQTSHTGCSLTPL